MKRLICFFATMVLLFALSTISFPQDITNPYPQDNYNVIEENYLAGFNSGNTGIKIDCAYFLGEMKSHKAVLPLMELFRNATNGGQKLVAAWSLLKIGDERGVALVKREVDFGDCDEIKCMLHHLCRFYDFKAQMEIAQK